MYHQTVYIFNHVLIITFQVFLFILNSVATEVYRQENRALLTSSSYLDQRELKTNCSRDNHFSRDTFTYLNDSKWNSCTAEPYKIKTTVTDHSAPTYMHSTDVKNTQKCTTKRMRCPSLSAIYSSDSLSQCTFQRLHIGKCEYYL